MSRFRAVALLGALVAAAPNLAVGQASSAACETRALEAAVVRTDARSKRLFVVASERDLVEATSRSRIVGDLQALVADCQPGWDQDWNVSFFSSAALAGYKDEEALREPAMNGEWAEAYLAEFTMSDRRLTIYPAVPAQSRWYAVE